MNVKKNPPRIVIECKVFLFFTYFVMQAQKCVHVYRISVHLVWYFKCATLRIEHNYYRTAIE